MAAIKMTREEMIEKLTSLRKGTRVRWQDKIYTVMYVHPCGGKLHRHDTGWLEDGKPEIYWEPGKYQAAGRMLEFSNVKHRTLYAQPKYMDFEVLE